MTSCKMRYPSLVMKIEVLLLILIVTRTLGQDRTLSTDSDTIFWHQYYDEIKNQIGLEPIDKVQGDFYFRLWTGVDVIELRKVGSTIIADVTFLVQEYKEDEEGKIYFKKTQITPATGVKIYDLISLYKVITLPTDKLIKGWGSGLDGITYFIETADERSYACKAYWTPTLYKDKLVEAKQLVDFLDEIDRIEELNLIGKAFIEQQPFSTWYSFIGSAVFVVSNKR